MKDKRELAREMTAKSRLSNAMLLTRAVLGLVPMVLVIYLVHLFLEGTLSPSAIACAAAAMAACVAGKAVCMYAATWKAHQAAYSCLTDIRLRIVRHLKKLPLGFFQIRRPGDLANIMRNDVEQVEVYLAHGLPESASATLFPAAAFVLMLAVDWRLALCMLAGLPLMWLVKKAAAPAWARGFEIVAQYASRMQNSLMEYVANIAVVKAFGKEERKTEETIRAARDYVSWATSSMNDVSVPMALIALFMESGTVLVLIVGTWLLSTGGISIEHLILSMVLSTAFTSSVAKTATLQHYRFMFDQAMTGIESVLGVETADPIKDSEEPRMGDIELNGVSFSYPQSEEDGSERKRALDSIDLVFRKGSTNALVGSSGCGKSTLASLIMGFWQPSSGHITVGGRDLSRLSERQVSGLFSIVQQDVFLFNQSIEENILIGRPGATHEEVVEAAQRARIHDFISGLPHGYATVPGEGGVQLSGGERQRISIARVMLKDAPVIILDEATAAVDAENETLIQEAIDDLSRDKTVVSIAHHLNAIRGADQIMVMREGRVAGSGTHEELMRACPLYQEMVAKQKQVDNWDIREAASW
ncbi:ABC transporter ATP-binding protein [Slackia exigua]|uniref:ABC transporter, ATP-binding protein n=1 Tax=Slackia exigua (strain ATCC 700122 / DSM 15923 / CIP 105133 / JCM 11022 / KCTC 5966 / S-7) TaxID=649764 RepID=D0WF82_SLAES|nr:ABC transporter ATP-binding protein [Slackia exigua]EEZ61766.1 ABC transporter, ATP-binding protein [Slackia exigua ATCC 700122]STN98758.1 Putative multidrug export ATP-binding/permease protein SAV1866 [Slackia exigua]